MVEFTDKGMKGLVHRLGQEYPKRKKLRITNIEEITAGWETKIYAFSLAYEEDGKTHQDDLIIRFYQGPQQHDLKLFAAQSTPLRYIYAP